MKRCTPILEIPTFSGNYINWPNLYDLFMETTHKNQNLTKADLPYTSRLYLGDFISLCGVLPVLNGRNVGIGTRKNTGRAEKIHSMNTPRRSHRHHPTERADPYALLWDFEIRSFHRKKR